MNMGRALWGWLAWDAALSTCLLLIGLAAAPSARAGDDAPPAPNKADTPGGFGDRASGALHDKLVKELGGSDESEAAVARGLRWLALHQAPDGHWSLDNFQKFAHKEPRPDSPIFNDGCVGGVARKDDVAATAFALLPFLGAGYTQKPPASRKKGDPDYSKTVKAGLDYLSDQELNGSFGGSMYSHALATIAVCEAYGMTADRILKPTAQDAVDYIVSAQDPAGGGWRYSPRTAGDLSVTGWMLTALDTARLAGLDVPKDALKKAEAFLDAVSDSKGGYSYLPGSGATPAMTAVGMLCRQHLGINPRNPGLLKGVVILKEAPPGTTDNIYYEYYAAQVVFHMGGDSWDFWNKGPNGDGKYGIRDYLIARQDKLAKLDPKKACQDGSWPPDRVWGANGGGRIMCTSLSLLTLEVYYRHLPLYRKGLAPKDKE